MIAESKHVQFDESVFPVWRLSLTQTVFVEEKDFYAKSGELSREPFIQTAIQTGLTSNRRALLTTKSYQRFYER